jgi:hypothetical protein
MNGDLQDELVQMMEVYFEAFDEMSKTLAQSQHDYYQELQEAGFSEDQALEILLESDFDIGGAIE